MHMNAVKYSDMAKGLATKVFSELRPVIKLPDETLKGSRFNGDFRLQWILESQAIEEEFMKDPRMACEKALIEAAKSDYYYAREKQWEDKAPNYDEEIENAEVEE